MTKRIYLQKRDVEKILEVINKFPNQDQNYKLEYHDDSGIGYSIDLVLKYNINGFDGEFRIPIVDDVDAW